MHLRASGMGALRKGALQCPRPVFESGALDAYFIILFSLSVKHWLIALITSNHRAS